MKNGDSGGQEPIFNMLSRQPLTSHHCHQPRPSMHDRLEQWFHTVDVKNWNYTP